MKPIKNEVMLINYANSMGNNLKELESVLDKYFTKAVKGIHIKRTSLFFASLIQKLIGLDS